MMEYSLTLSKKLELLLYLDCWAGNDKLKNFYLNNGFKHVGDFPEEDYFISVFKGDS